MNIYVGTYLKIYRKKVVKPIEYTFECKECNKKFKNSEIGADMKYCGSCGKKYNITEIPREKYELDSSDIFGSNSELSTIENSAPYIYIGTNQNSDSETCLLRDNIEYVYRFAEIDCNDILITKQNFKEYFAKEIKFLIDNKRDFEILTGVLMI